MMSGKLLWKHWRWGGVIGLLICFSAEFLLVSAEIIPSDRKIDWSVVGIPNGIPNVAQGADVTTFGAIPNDGGDDATAIQAAINAVKNSPNNAVYLPAGTYHLGKNLRLDGSVVLRGAGPEQTHLVWQSGAGNGIYVAPSSNVTGEWVAVSADVAKHSTIITVANTASFAVGQFIEIEKENNPTLMYTQASWEISWAANSVGEIGLITAINGNQITLQNPLHIQYELSYNPQVRPIALLQNVGIESLHLDRSLDSADAELVTVEKTAYFWEHRVESEWASKVHISTNLVYGCEIRNNYFHEAHDYGGDKHGYGIELNRHTTNCRIEDNIFDTLRHAMLVHLGANGNVFGYNYARNAVQSQGGTWLPPDISIHGHYAFANLFEGNIVEEIGIGDYWGAGGTDNTYFRNCVTRDGINLYDNSHDQNIVGNKLDTGSNTILSADGTSQNLLIHGNYQNGTVEWDSSIADHTLANSYYLAGKPTFYSAQEWPSTGADQANCFNPAQLRQANGTPFNTAPLPTPTLPPPTPVPTGEGVYLDLVGTGWENAHWGGNYSEIIDPLQGGNDKVWSVQYTATWSSLRFRRTDSLNYSYTDFAQLCLDLYYPTQMPTIVIRAQNDNIAGTTYTQFVGAGSGAWHTYCYDLQNWKPANLDFFDAIRIQDQNIGATQPLFYVDNVILKTNSTPVPSQTPVATQSPTSTPTQIPTSTPAQTPTSTATQTPTQMPIPTKTPTPAATNVPTQISLTSHSTIGRSPLGWLLTLALVVLIVTVRLRRREKN